MLANEWKNEQTANVQLMGVDAYAMVIFKSKKVRVQGVGYHGTPWSGYRRPKPEFFTFDELQKLCASNKDADYQFTRVLDVIRAA